MFRLLCTFLSLATPVASAQGNGPPAFVDLPWDVQERFASNNMIKPGFKFKDLPIQAVATHQLKKTKLTTRCNGRVVSLDGLEPSRVMSESTSCHLDDQEVPCPNSVTYKKKEGDVKVTVAMSANDEQVDSVQVIIDGCGVETFSIVSPGLVTSIPAKAYDDDELRSKFVYGDVTNMTNNLGSQYLRTSPVLKYTNKTAATATTGSVLQGISCPSKSIKLALAFDSSYCAQQGSYINAVSALERLVSNVATLYEASTCFKLEVGHIEGYCNPSADVYKPGVEINKSGCGSTTGLLQFFRDFWNNNRTNVDRDLAHFVSGTGLECSSKGCVIGCAYNGPLCTSRAFSYGVNFMTFTGNQALQDTLLAHELGHNIGSPHDNDISNDYKYIMEPFINDGSSGFSPNSQNAFASQPQGCLDEAGSPVSTAPTVSPPTHQCSSVVSHPCVTRDDCCSPLKCRRKPERGGKICKAA